MNVSHHDVWRRWRLFIVHSAEITHARDPSEANLPFFLSFLLSFPVPSEGSTRTCTYIANGFKIGKKGAKVRPARPKEKEKGRAGGSTAPPYSSNAPCGIHELSSKKEKKVS